MRQEDLLFNSYRLNRCKKLHNFTPKWNEIMLYAADGRIGQI